MLQVRKQGYIFNTAFLLKALLALIFIAPTKMQMIKLGLVGIIILCQVGQSRYRRDDFKLRKSVFVWLAIFVAVNLYFLLKGTWNNPTLFFTFVTSTVISPIILFVAIIANGDLKKINMDKFMLFLLATIAVYTLSYILLHKVGIINIRVSPLLGTQLNYDGGYFYFFTQNSTSLFYLVPFCIARFMIKDKASLSKKYKVLYIITIALIAIAVLLTGRRALLVLCVATPFLVYFIKNIKNPGKIVLLVGGGLFSLLLLALVLPAVTQAFNMSEEKFGSLAALFDVGAEREEQLAALLRGLVSNNLLGAGYGVNAEESIRSSVAGIYELTYVTQLFALGIIGGSLMFIFYISVYWNTIKEINRNTKFYKELLPHIVGLAIIMIAAFSNPYFGNFDYCWLFFFPLAYIMPKEKYSRKRVLPRTSNAIAGGL